VMRSEAKKPRLFSNLQIPTALRTPFESQRLFAGYYPRKGSRMTYTNDRFDLAHVHLLRALKAIEADGLLTSAEALLPHQRMETPGQHQREERKKLGDAKCFYTERLDRAKAELCSLQR
jgi:hypothetical protein